MLIRVNSFKFLSRDDKPPFNNTFLNVTDTNRPKVLAWKLLIGLSMICKFTRLGNFELTNDVNSEFLISWSYSKYVRSYVNDVSFELFRMILVNPVGI